MPDEFDPVYEQDMAQPETATQDPAPTDEAPEEVTAAPEPAPAPEWLSQLTKTMQQTADIQRQEVERRQADEQRRAMEAAQPRPLLQRQEWRDEFIDVQQRASSFDTQAAQRLLEMQSELADERATQQMQRLLDQQLGPMRLEMQAGARLEAAAQSAAQAHQGFLQPTDFTRAADELFGGNRAQLAMLLDPQNPNAAQVQQQISAYAVGQAVLSGRIAQLPNKPAPANPRSAARSNPGAAAKPVNEITDPQAVLDALYFGGN